MATPTVDAGAAGAPGAAVAPGSTGVAGSGNVAPDPAGGSGGASGSSGSSGAAGAGSEDAGPSAPDGGGDGGWSGNADAYGHADVAEAGATSDAGARSDGASDAGQDAMGGDTGKGATDARIPSTCNYEIEYVRSELHYPLCGTTTPGGTYQFSRIVFRRPIFDPPPMDPFTDGTMTVKNGATVNTYVGVYSASPTGYEILFAGPNSVPIVFEYGVNEITVTTHDSSGRVGCLPQPCTWTVGP
jgi:hypothetical protein